MGDSVDRDPRYAPPARAHPWHGISSGPSTPQIVHVYVEVVPTDTIKYELDKESGFLKVDRPQKYSNVCPTLYGLIPRTYCDREVATLCAERTGRVGIVGDGDPLDVCVLAEKTIPRGDLLLRAIPIGGLRMIDGAEADDKIIATLEGDAMYGEWSDIGQCPRTVLDRLEHYFLTYKDLPGEGARTCEIAGVYGRDEAHEVIRRSLLDYENNFLAR